MQTKTDTFTADGRWTDIARFGLKQIGLALAVPLVLHLMGAPMGSALIGAAAGLVMLTLLTLLRLSWGTRIAFQPGSVHVDRRDGSTLEIPAASITHMKTKPDCFVIAWRQEDQKRRSLVVAQEGFASATWPQVLAAAKGLEQSRAGDNK